MEGIFETNDKVKMYEYIIDRFLDDCEKEYGEYSTDTKSARVKTLYCLVRRHYPELYELTLTEFIEGLIRADLELYHPEGYWFAPNLDSVHIRGKKL